MEISVRTIYFSPTGTTKRIVEAIGQSLGRVEDSVDLTGQRGDFPDGLRFQPNDVVIFGTPVYSGRAQKDALKALEKMNGNGARIVAVAIYGNRAYEDALVEVLDMAEIVGFVPVAAGAFIGEHSFASSNYPLAMGRPDPEDLMKAKDFGSRVRTKIFNNQDLSIQESVPGNRPYRSVSRREQAPLTDEHRCIRCGRCVNICPNQAIELQERIITSKQLCMMCCACIRTCPTQARGLDPEMEGLAEKLYQGNRERKEPIWFL